MSTLEIDVDGSVFRGTLLDHEAPESTAALREILPMESTLLHVRWSGFATWVNLEGSGLAAVPRENHTVYPSRGDVLLYPGFKNDKELLLACGPTCFKSPAGEQAGNHVATVDASRETLRSLEETTLENGGQDVTVRIVE
jgi:hypothetical protein